MLSYTFDLAVAHINVVLVVVALVTNLFACFNANRIRVWIYGSTVVLCVVYIVSYAILLADFPARILAWSRIMRGVSIVAWVVVWIVPSIADVKIFRKRVAQSDRLEAEVDEKLASRSVV